MLFVTPIKAQTCAHALLVLITCAHMQLVTHRKAQCAHAILVLLKCARMFLVTLDEAKTCAHAYLSSQSLHTRVTRQTTQR